MPDQLKKSCPSCGFPEEAGHSHTCELSPDSRERYLAFTSNAEPVVLSKEESDALDEEERSFLPSEQEIAERDELRRKEKEGFEKHGWKKWDGMEPPNSFRNEDWYEDDFDDNDIGVPSASKVPNGTKFTIAWGSEGDQWFTEGASSIPPEADLPYSSYKVWVAHEGIWELIEERDELESQASFYRIGAWHEQ